MEQVWVVVCRNGEVYMTASPQAAQETFEARDGCGIRTEQVPLVEAGYRWRPSGDSEWKEWRYQLRD